MSDERCGDVYRVYLCSRVKGHEEIDPQRQIHRAFTDDGREVTWPVRRKRGAHEALPMAEFLALKGKA